MAKDALAVPPSDFFSLLTPSERTALLAHSRVRAFDTHEFVFRAGSPGETVYILTEGRVKIFGLSKKEVIWWLCFPGEIFGLAEAMRNGPREVYAQACSACRLYAISQRDFRKFISDHSNAALVVIEMLSCRLRGLGQMMQNLTNDDVRTRLIKLLMRLCARYGQQVGRDIKLAIPLTHQEIADMIGTTRQTVNGALGELRREGAIYVDGHFISVREPRWLEQLGSDADFAASVQANRSEKMRQG